MGGRGDAFDGLRRFAGACRGAGIVLAASLIGLPAAAAAPDASARLSFGAKETPAALSPAVVGSYAKGCLAGAERLSDAGPGFQTMRPSRNRAWGHPSLVKFLQDLGKTTTTEGLKPLLIGDLAQPRGGPMLTGHASHQIGLDADIWFRPGPGRLLTEDEREGWSAYSVFKSVRKPWVNEKFTAREARVIELAARDRRTARIFVAAAIKQALCVATPETERAWLRKVRPWYGHKDHLHVRLACPAADAGCTAQTAPPPGDGCGAELTSWLKPPPVVKPTKPKAKPKKKRARRDITLAELPKACVAVLEAGAPK